jgi:hypothetical protein
MSRRTGQRRGRTGGHFQAKPDDLRVYEMPPAGPVTITSPDGSTRVEPPKTAQMRTRRSTGGSVHIPSDAGRESLSDPRPASPNHGLMARQ